MANDFSSMKKARVHSEWIGTLFHFFFQQEFDSPTFEKKPKKRFQMKKKMNLEIRSHQKRPSLGELSGKWHG